MSPEVEFWAGVFMPYATHRVKQMRDSKGRFVHYTSAESAQKILNTGEVYLRNSRAMNDFSEVQHGAFCLDHAWQAEEGQRLQRLLGEIQPDLATVLAQNFQSIVEGIGTETYLISISQHEPDDDAFGKLSMWRAYAPRNGVALVFNSGPFVNDSDALGAYTTPVAYCTAVEFVTHFKEVVDNIEANLDQLKKLGGAFVHEWLVWAFQGAMQATKHPAFKEEQEWRVVYSPTVLEKRGQLTEERKQRVPCKHVTLGGVPQRVFTIPFKDYPDENFMGATLRALLDRVLVGPSNDALLIRRVIDTSAKGLGR